MADSAHKSARMDQPKFDKQKQSDDRTEKEIGSESYPEEQATVPAEFTRKESTNYNDNSDRV